MSPSARLTPLLLWLSSFASAWAGGGPPPVRDPRANGYVDWTSLDLIVSSRSDLVVGAWKDRRVQEQDALDSLPPRLAAAAASLRVTPDTTVADLLGDGGPTAVALEDGMKSWYIEETRYHPTGGVEMDAALDIGVWLRPALSALATATPAPLVAGGATGLVIDARGLPFEPCLAPSVSTADGRPVLRAQLLGEDVARVSTPVVYVSSAADPLAWKRAGDAPLFARASAAQGGELLLDPTSALAADPATPGLVAAGKVVIVVGAP